jgi:hypothetical protein
LPPRSKPLLVIIPGPCALDLKRLFLKLGEVATRAGVAFAISSTSVGNS